MTHGGARPGAGRKRLSDEDRKVTLSIRISPKVHGIIRDISAKHSLSPGEVVECMALRWQELYM